MKVVVHRDKDELAEAAAHDFTRRARGPWRRPGASPAPWPKGSTPKATYEILAHDHADEIDWSRVHFFFGDERTVPRDHEDSNYRMAHDALPSRVPVGSVHRMRGELPPEEATSLHEEELREFFDASGSPPGLFSRLLSPSSIHRLSTMWTVWRLVLK